MPDTDVLKYVFKDPLECNLSYMPFIKGGGLFLPSMKEYALGDQVIIDLTLPGKNDSMRIEGRVVWITPKNALHHVISGIGIQFTGADAQTIRYQLEAQLDTKIEVGGYTYGITEETKKEKS
ncbi:MAG TPA: PilZ domain-containing protein [Gammaproteobacteria bacterium]|jgi:type IV pilus assembly protein PilZ|nr:PilZ domain-containing protein [Gammaproteobacteria bacterium]